MVDIHSHIIPGIDDGAQSLEEALEIIRMEVSGGTTAFVATPHVYSDSDMRDSAQIAERLTEVREAVAREGISVELYAGAEVYPFSSIAEGLAEGLPISVGGHGKHMLLDLPMTGLPMDFGQLIFEIQSLGVTPILAHPERNSSFQAEPESLRRYLEKGVLCQVNAASLRGKYGPRANEVAMFFLERHWPSFLASDIHKPRPEPLLGKVAGDLADELDAEYLRIITMEAGLAISKGEPVPVLPKPAYAVREPESQPGFFSRLFGRR